eukprot:1580992-Rhodomonas_salina.7
MIVRAMIDRVMAGIHLAVVDADAADGGSRAGGWRCCERMSRLVRAWPLGLGLRGPRTLLRAASCQTRP